MRKEEIDRRIELIRDYVENNGKGKLDAEFKEEWADALESGKYKQATGYLCEVERGKKPGFCCLGVAYDISEDAHWILEGEYWEGQSTWRYGVPDQRFEKDDERAAMNTMNLPEWVSDDVNLTDFVKSQLADANDSGATFKQLARMIREAL